MRLFKRSDTGVWYAEYYDWNNGVRRVTTKQTLKSDAERVVKEAKIEEIEMVARAEYIKSKLAVSSIGGQAALRLEAAIAKWTDWMRSVHIPLKTADCYRVYLLAFMRDTGLQSRLVHQIKTEEIDAWVNRSIETKKLATIQMRYKSLNHFFKYCAGVGIVLRNPMETIRVDRSRLTHAQMEPYTREAFTADEIQTLLAMTAPGAEHQHYFWNLAVKIGAATGLRLGDIARLERDSVDAVEGKLIVWTRKTYARVELRIGKELAQEILNRCEPSSRFVFPHHAARYARNEDVHEFSREFTELCQKLGIQGKSFHCLRHTFARRRMQEILAMEHVAKELGHSSIETTQKYLGTTTQDHI